jgi:hypothetical protein
MKHLPQREKALLIKVAFLSAAENILTIPLTRVYVISFSVVVTWSFVEEGEGATASGAVAAGCVSFECSSAAAETTGAGGGIQEEDDLGPIA